jgi:hypothetical protein
MPDIPNIDMEALRILLDDRETLLVDALPQNPLCIKNKGSPLGLSLGVRPTNTQKDESRTMTLQRLVNDRETSSITCEYRKIVVVIHYDDGLSNAELLAIEYLRQEIEVWTESTVLVNNLTHMAYVSQSLSAHQCDHLSPNVKTTIMPTLVTNDKRPPRCDSTHIVLNNNTDSTATHHDCVAIILDCVVIITGAYMNWRGSRRVIQCDDSQPRNPLFQVYGALGNVLPLGFEKRMHGDNVFSMGENKEPEYAKSMNNTYERIDTPYMEELIDDLSILNRVILLAKLLRMYVITWCVKITTELKAFVRGIREHFNL